jgi:Flp pilus assembly protein TadD
MCDRWLGFSVAPALPMANAMQQELTVSLQKVNTQHESPEAMTALGEVYYQLGQLEEANTAFENAVLLNPNDAKAHYLHGLTRAINRLSFADGDTMRAVFLRIYRDNVRTYINYGRMLYDRNFRHKSVEVLAGVVQKYPNDAISHQALAMALFGTGEHEHGIDEMKIAHRLDPNSTQISNELNVMLGMKANQ